MRRPSPVIVLLALLVSTACRADGEWAHEILLAGDHGLGGCAVGELDASSRGPEVVAVDESDGVWIVRRLADGWSPQRVHQGRGELIMCAIGDVDNRYEGQRDRRVRIQPPRHAGPSRR